MGATIGKGFREISRPQLSSRPLSMNDLPERRAGRGMRGVGDRAGGWNNAYGSQVGKDPKPLDITSLHFAVAPDRVNIHIDQTGFVFEGANLELMVGPNFGGSHRQRAGVEDPVAAAVMAGRAHGPDHAQQHQ